MFEPLPRGVLYAVAEAAWFLLMSLGGQSDPVGFLKSRRDHFCALRIPHPRFQVVAWSIGQLVSVDFSMRLGPHQYHQFLVRPERSRIICGIGASVTPLLFAWTARALTGVDEVAQAQARDN